MNNIFFHLKKKKFLHSILKRKSVSSPLRRPRNFIFETTVALFLLLFLYDFVFFFGQTIFVHLKNHGHHRHQPYSLTLKPGRKTEKESRN